LPAEKIISTRECGCGHKAWGGAHCAEPQVVGVQPPRHKGDSECEETAMSSSYTNLLYHIIFSTKDRQPLITRDYQERLYEYIGGTIRGLGEISLAINGTEDHVHVPAKLRPDRALSDVLRDLKANASGWMHDLFPDLKDFSWQRGYDAFTVSQSHVDKVRDYIARQHEHHQTRSFREEFIRFLKTNGVEYDERYL
jgi:REP element-mobilizing transposase RayT